MERKLFWLSFNGYTVMRGRFRSCRLVECVNLLKDDYHCILHALNIVSTTHRLALCSLPWLQLATCFCWCLFDFDGWLLWNVLSPQGIFQFFSFAAIRVHSFWMARKYACEMGSRDWLRLTWKCDDESQEFMQLYGLNITHTRLDVFVLLLSSWPLFEGKRFVV